MFVYILNWKSLTVIKLLKLENGLTPPRKYHPQRRLRRRCLNLLRFFPWMRGSVAMSLFPPFPVTSLFPTYPTRKVCWPPQHLLFCKCPWATVATASQVGHVLVCHLSHKKLWKFKVSLLYFSHVIYNKILISGKFICLFGYYKILN